MISIILWLVFGLLVGIVAKFLHPGEDPVGLLPTIGIGIAGSFIGGAIQWLFNMGGPFSPAGFLWSVVGGVVFCFFYRQRRINQFITEEGRAPK